MLDYLKKAFKFFLNFVKNTDFPIDIQENMEFMKIYHSCKPYTMTSPERMFALYNAIKYVIQNNVEGDFVECGVWKGGSSMIIALTLKQLGVMDRKIYLYDTYEGMSNPTSEDFDIVGRVASKELQEKSKGDDIWCYSSLDEVKANLAKTGYPEQNLFFVKGKVEDTVPGVIPENISLLRLDTDWYESTKHELEFLFPLLNTTGVLIIDDYGHWKGSNKAVNEYIQRNKLKLLLNRIDYTGVIGIKQ